MQKMPKARPGIDGLLVSMCKRLQDDMKLLWCWLQPILNPPPQKHPFLMYYDDSCEEIIAVWVRKVMEQIRIMKRFPSDMSLASTSSSASGRSGISGQSSRITTSSAQAFQYMDTS